MQELHDVFSIAIALIMMAIFLSAIKKIWHGFTSWRAGEQDVTELLGGLLMIVTPFIVYGLYKYLGVSDSAIDPKSIKAILDFKK